MLFLKGVVFIPALIKMFVIVSVNVFIDISGCERFSTKSWIRTTPSGCKRAFHTETCLVAVYNLYHYLEL